MPKKKSIAKDMSNEELIRRTQDVEDEKIEKKRIRLEKREAKLRKQKHEKIEKLVAPVLLIVTILISFIVSFFRN